MNNGFWFSGISPPRLADLEGIGVVRYSCKVLYAQGGTSSLLEWFVRIGFSYLIGVGLANNTLQTASKAKW